MKKRLCLLLAVAMLFTMVSGCGGSQPEASDVPAASGAAEEVPEAAHAAESAQPEAAVSLEASEIEPEDVVDEELELAKETELSFFPVDDSQTISVAIKWFDVLYPLILGDDERNVGWYQWLSEATGMDMDYKVYGTNNMSTTVPLDIAAGDLPDVITFNIGDYYPAGMSAAIDEDIIIDLAPMYKKYMPFYYELLNSDLDYLTTAFTPEGYLPYAVGVISENVGTDGGWIMRKDWLDEAHLDVPQTFDEWYKALTAFKENGHANALWIPYHGSAANEGLSAGFGISSNLTHGDVPVYFDVQDDMRAKFGPLEDSYFDFLSMMNKWYQEDLIYKDFYSATEEDFPSSSLHTQELLGIFSGTVGELTSTVNYYDAGSTYNPIGVKSPVQNEGDILYLGRKKISGANTNGAWSIAGTCNSENIELAMRMIDLFYTEEGTTFANYGLEGKTYTVDEQGNIAYTEFVTNNELGLPFDPIIACFGMTDGPFYLTPERTMICYNDMQQEAMKLWGDNEAPVTNFTMDQDTSYQVAAIKADLATYIMEQQVRFIIGEIPLTQETFDEFRDALVSMGAEELVDLYESAYTSDADNRSKIAELFSA